MKKYFYLFSLVFLLQGFELSAFCESDDNDLNQLLSFCRKRCSEALIIDDEELLEVLKHYKSVLEKYRFFSASALSMDLSTNVEELTQEELSFDPFCKDLIKNMCTDEEEIKKFSSLKKIKASDLRGFQLSTLDQKKQYLLLKIARIYSDMVGFFSNCHYERYSKSSLKTKAAKDLLEVLKSGERKCLKDCTYFFTEDLSECTENCWGRVECEVSDIYRDYEPTGYMGGPPSEAFLSHMKTCYENPEISALSLKKCVRNCEGKDLVECKEHCYGGGEQPKCKHHCDGHAPSCNEHCYSDKRNDSCEKVCYGDSLFCNEICFGEGYQPLCKDTCRGDVWGYTFIASFAYRLFPQFLNYSSNCTDPLHFK